MTKFFMLLFRAAFGAQFDEWQDRETEAWTKLIYQKVVEGWIEGYAEGRCRVTFGTTWADDDKMVICRQHAQVAIIEGRQRASGLQSGLLAESNQRH